MLKQIRQKIIFSRPFPAFGGAGSAPPPASSVPASASRRRDGKRGDQAGRGWEGENGGRGQSVVEYMILIVFILGAFLVMQKYIVRGFAGRWKDIGDSLGQGRLYDSNKTIECAYDFRYYNMWYGVKKYEEHGCTQACSFETVFAGDDVSQKEKACQYCICQSQQYPECEETQRSCITGGQDPGGNEPDGNEPP